MNSASGNDDEWMARIREGDEHALILLMRKYHTHLWKYVRAVLGQADLADEAATNVFLSLWRRRESILIKTSVRHYLFSAAAKQAANFLPGVIRRNALLPLEEVAPDVLLIPNEAHASQLYEELQAEVDRLITAMPRQRQLIFKMNRLENMQYKEIGRILGISVFTVRNHMAKAIEAIEAALPGIRRRLRGEVLPEE
ncbi:RNA polymerase sigma factor [Geminisphaera colitermitum]|uniref:RNA polymerase sigma factor n=1 Tax=Geminisphaera colitermitum TaxID=1148786 RepID=UPI0002F6057C|nr:sigma-70 family RNA polymerase sigma factor [Geminisphaera colitermitum]